MSNKILNNKLLVKILQETARVYKKNFSYLLAVSPHLFFPTSCRFYPTCSEYFAEAIGEQGLIKGSILSLKRISKCNPLGGQDLN
ncbi:MAG: membrane protein insertion efficiency factor YidD [Candidatus Yanofskybacteria bacterium]|nr:membrane protein insertion efficiency factor YidD [Candidatus Yanofskybacteria bacterium]